eukprot:TRINITY_DN782061_c0_g1_i1.p2 TRINITY_DN782061_c0_g1~~TRINITY_DN782061_c0_g1_i1.p2  ORF type:complete len:226 (-),score=28.32 TRINITY_DN782061_c0_g1_i1:1072-1749(-)
MAIKGNSRNGINLSKKATYSESDVAKVLMDHYSDQDVYPEVPTGNGICDIIIKDYHIYTAIEVKRSFSFDVLEQAIRNKKIAHYSMIAVPKFQKISFKRQLCRDYGIGLILVDMDMFMYNGFHALHLTDEAKFNRGAVIPKLEDWMKRSVSGSKNDRMTAFKVMIEDIEHRLKREGGRAKFEDVFSLGLSTYSTVQSAKHTLKNHIRSGVIDSFTFEGSELILKF